LRWLHCIGEGDDEIISRLLAIEAEKPVDLAAAMTSCIDRCGCFGAECGRAMVPR
jgi:hypothetical protein